MHIPYYICSMKVETRHYSYIITASLIGRALILVKMSVETFKTRVHLMGFFYRQHHVFHSTMIDNFQYQSQFVDTENTTQ